MYTNISATVNFYASNQGKSFLLKLMPLAFPNTRWTRILAQRSKGGETTDHSDQKERERLSGDLCQDYWKPVYSFLRASGFTQEDAEDLTQGFFAMAFESDFFWKADPSLGKLRSYLLAAVKYYVASRRRSEKTQKRGGEFRFVPLDILGEEQSQFLGRSPASPCLAPDAVFDRRWAECILETALVRLRDEFTVAGKGALYEAMRPLLDGEGDVSAAAKQANMSEGTMRVTLHRFRKRYREQIQEQIQESLAPGGSVEEEFAHLLNALRSGMAS